MVTTPFGKAMRRLRVDRELLLKEVADRLNVSTTFLSSVESGRKPIPGDLVRRLQLNFDLTAAETDALQEAADLSKREFCIALDETAPPAARMVAAQLAREFAGYGEGKIDALRQVMLAA